MASELAFARLRNVKMSWQEKVGQVVKQQMRDLMLGTVLDGPGIPAKLGQLLGNDHENLRSLDSSRLKAQLTGDEALILVKERNPELAEAIQSFDSNARAASLGQVHRATLKNGAQVAIKIQYPDLEPELKTQLDRLIRLAELSPGRNMGFSAERYRDYFTQILTQELDYGHEAQNQIRYFNATSEQEKIVIPRVYPRYSGRHILTQSFEESQGISSLVELPLDKKTKIARKILNHFTKTLFDQGMVHADPHIENWGYRAYTDELVLYDFGSVLCLAPETTSAIREWVDATLSEQGADFLKCFVKMGFDGERLMPIRHQLEYFSKKLLKPFFKLSLNEYKVESVIGAEKWTFRMAGPPWFLILMRAGRYWSQAFERLGSSELDSSQLDSLQGFDLNKTHEPVSPQKVLRIRLSEGSEVRVDLTLPARSLSELESLMPEAALDEIKKKNGSITEIKEKLSKIDDRFEMAMDKGRMIEIWAESSK